MADLCTAAAMVEIKSKFQLKMRRMNTADPLQLHRLVLNVLFKN